MSPPNAPLSLPTSSPLPKMTRLSSNGDSSVASLVTPEPHAQPSRAFTGLVSIYLRNSAPSPPGSPPFLLLSPVLLHPWPHDPVGRTCCSPGYTHAGSSSVTLNYINADTFSHTQGLGDMSHGYGSTAKPQSNQNHKNKPFIPRTTPSPGPLHSQLYIFTLRLMDDLASEFAEAT